MPATFNLDAYLTRIGYQGVLAATLPVLSALHSRHVCTIPFENLDVLSGRGIRIDLPSLKQKLVHDRRGGYCFEHNTLFAAVLQTVGFDVTTLAARVRWNLPAGTILPRTHMILQVKCAERRYLVDVGFGGVPLTAPLLLEPDARQDNAHARRRLLPVGDGSYLHQVWRGDTWLDVYQFTTEPQTVADYEMANWYTSTHPASRFRQNLVVALSGAERHATLLNRDLTVRHDDGRIDRAVINEPAELLTVLRTTFGLSFPPGTRFGSAGAPWPH